MPIKRLAQNFLLPELILINAFKSSKRGITILAQKSSDFEVCPKCAAKSSKVHDRRWVKSKDAPHRGLLVYFKILKRRFRCPKCKSVFTEPIPGIKKSARVTQRFEKNVLWACENFADLKKVRKAHDCGYKLIYRCFYNQLGLKQKQRDKTPWPKTIGIDEHGFSKDKRRGARNFATLVVDYNNKKPRELIEGKSHAAMLQGLAHIPGRENVKNVVIDLSDSYKGFVRKFFPNAKIVADKFHVLRLITPALNKKRINTTGDKRKHWVRKLLLRNRRELDFEQRIELDFWLKSNPQVKELYLTKEKLHTLYSCRGLGKARRSLHNLTKWLEKSQLKELQRLRRTLLKWSEEILRYFSTKITNARTEAFNNRAKLVQRQAYGFKRFENYRLKFLNVCF